CAAISPLSVGPPRPGRLSERPQSIATIRTGVRNPCCFYALRRLVEPPLPCRCEAAYIVVTSGFCPEITDFCSSRPGTHPTSPSCPRCPQLAGPVCSLAEPETTLRVTFCNLWLLEFDPRPDLLQGCLDLLGLVLGNALLDRLGRALDQVLGLLEAEA